MGTLPSPPKLIGRTKERRSLDALLDAIRVGQSRVLIVRGEAGMGKSALLHHLIDEASGIRVVHATGVESEMELPFAALHQLCAPLLDRLDALPDPQRDAAGAAFGLTTGRAPDRLLIGLAVLHLLSAASDDGPVLCIVDDAQWLDRASLQALTFVARRLLADPVAMVFVAREASPDFSEFPELVVERLHDGDAQTLLSAVLHVPLDERVRDRIVAETSGNPLAILEWPRGLTPTELAGGFGMPALMPMSGQIEESFRRRLTDLPEPTRRFLTVAAAEPTGDAVIVWRAASRLGLNPAAATPAIDAGLVEIGVRVSFRHPLVRSAVYGAASLADRQAAHQTLAETTDAKLDPDRRAWHRALGSPGPDEDIAEALEQSADRARDRGGLAAAGALLERSAALTLEPSRRVERMLAAARAHLEAGSFAAAGALLAAAEAMPVDAIGGAQRDLLRARLAMFGGDARDAPGLLLGAAKRLERLDADLAGATYLQATSAACIVGSLGRGVGLRDIAFAASKCPVPAVLTTKDWILTGLAQVAVDGPANAGPALRRALEATPDDTFAAQRFHWLGFQCGAALVLWDIDNLRRLALMHVSMTRELGALSVLPGALNTLARVFVLEGDLDGAASALGEAQQILSETGSDLFTSVIAILAGHRGGDGAAGVIADQFTNAQNAGLGVSVMSAQWAKATLLNGTGHYAQAFAIATEAMQHPWEWGGHLSFPELVEAAARCGQRAAAAEARERLAETTEESGSDWAIGVQRRSDALLADGAAAEGLFREAIDRLRRTPVRSELGRAYLLYGEWLRRESRRVDAREQLRTAYEMFTDMGMNEFAERARHELLATGETVRKRTPDSFDELTAQEAHIARLAADGHTNPEIGAQLFISPRTVEWHLRKVFTKLGVGSRRELREALPRQVQVSSSTR